MKKKTIVLVLCALCLTTLLTASLAYADIGPGEEYAEEIPSESASQDEYERILMMLNEIYANEPDALWRQIAIDYNLALTGYGNVTEYKNGVRSIGTYEIPYDRDSAFYNALKIPILGSCLCGVGQLNGNLFVALGSDEPIDETAFVRNISDLEMIYSLICDAKTATQNMSDIEKLRYIDNIVLNLIPQYASGSFASIANAINSGCGNCSAYSILTYLLGINCGLQITYDTGYLYGTSDSFHAWNEIVIDDVVYYHDVTGLWAGYNEYFLVLPKDYFSATLVSIQTSSTAH